MPTKVITTRCSNCPTTFDVEAVPEEQKHEVQELLEKKRFIAGEKYQGMKCPKCLYGTLTVTSYMVPGEITTGDKVPAPAGTTMYEPKGEVGTLAVVHVDEEEVKSVTMDIKGGPASDSITIGPGAYSLSGQDVITRRTELGDEILLVNKAMEWLTEKGKTESVLFRAADSYLIYLNQQVEELA